MRGDINTAYLPTVYPEGFQGKQLKPEEKLLLSAIAGCVFVKDRLRDRQFLNSAQGSKHSYDESVHTLHVSSHLLFFQATSIILLIGEKSRV